MKPLEPIRKFWNLLENHSMLIHPQIAMQVTGLGLTQPWERSVQAGFVIRGPKFEGAVASIRAANLESIEIASYNFRDTLPENYKGVEIKNLIVPPEHKDLGWVNQIRLMNHRLEYHEVARIFDHMTVWHHCMVKGQPHIVLEANARLTSRPDEYHLRNSIIGLDTGGKLYEHNSNYRVMPGVWAYAIDQFAAKRMFNRVMSQGIRDPLELMFRADQQMIVLANHAHKI